MRIEPSSLDRAQAISTGLALVSVCHATVRFRRWPAGTAWFSWLTRSAGRVCLSRTVVSEELIGQN